MGAFLVSLESNNDEPFLKKSLHHYAPHSSRATSDEGNLRGGCPTERSEELVSVSILSGGLQSRIMFRVSLFN
jgi:hypothetical protein